MENVISQPMETYGIYGTHTTEACPMNNKENRKLLLQVASTFEQDANAKGINVVSMYPGVAGLNIAPEVPAMTMFRHIIFGAVIGVMSKFLCGVRK